MTFFNRNSRFVHQVLQVAFVLFIVFNNFNFVRANAVQLTFELPDNEVQCFYEHVSKGVNTIVEFQVVTGGNYDVDMTMKSPKGKVLYQDQKKQYDSFRHQAEEEGVYEVCFSNEFSTYTHKVVFFDWQVGDEAPILGPASPEKAMTFMESSAQGIHDKLNQVLDHQTHYRLRETQGRAHGEDLNERVQLWSIAQLTVIVLVGVLQVTLIRSFFSNRR
jgi:protein ERP2